MIQKIFILVLVLTICLGIGLLLFSKTNLGSEQDTVDLVPSPTPKLTDLGSFSVQLPPNWNYEPQLGVDSQVGTFIGDGVTLLFDYGYYSNELAREGDPKYSVSYETIDGRRAKIVESKIPGQGLTGVYFEDVKPINPGFMPTKLGINGENIPSGLVEQVLSIYRSIDFTD